ncbi:MAG TPA: HD-GYP domain-containing protein [Solirubrobacteraceae bacterium]|jgi:HD-GYP domain-containing protein (c-di-GMP phosphodiesterase class II)
MSTLQSGESVKISRLDEAEQAAGALGAGIEGGGGPPPVQMLRYLPLSLLVTASIVVVPVLLVAALVPRGGVLSMAISALVGVAISLAIASIEASLWARRPRSRDLLFADLTLWGWLRRYWAERNLAATMRLYDANGEASPPVSIELLARLSKLLEARDAYTHGHSQRVARHAARIAKSMYLSPAEIAKIHTAALIHDVGKLYTPRRILNNPGRLTDAEFAVIKRHPGDGADMLAAVGDLELAAMVRHHHERIDGRGYPDGLTGLSIPLGARIIAVADTFDAITSSRAYRPAGTHQEALEILSHESGSQLDAAAVTAFLSCYRARRSVAWFSFAAVVPQRIVAGLQTASASIGAGAAGITSILPAVGAAGLLSLSPGLTHDKASAGGGVQRTTLARTTEQATPSTAALTSGEASQPQRHDTTGGKHGSTRGDAQRPSHNTATDRHALGSGEADEMQSQSSTPGSEGSGSSTNSTQSQTSGSSPSSPSNAPPANHVKEALGSTVEEATAPVTEAKAPHGTPAGVVGTVTETLSNTGETLSKTTESLTNTVNETLGNTDETLSKTTETLTGTVNETLSKTNEVLSKTTEALNETTKGLSETLGHL